MLRDWPHPLGSDETPAIARWRSVERVMVAALMIAALTASVIGASSADAARRKGGTRRVRSGAVYALPSTTGSFRSCAEARAAGAAPVRRGSPGYSRRLDRDGDGVGCE